MNERPQHVGAALDVRISGRQGQPVGDGLDDHAKAAFAFRQQVRRILVPLGQAEDQPKDTGFSPCEINISLPYGCHGL